MKRINDITSSDHWGYLLDVESNAITNPLAISTPSPFERKLNSKFPQAIRTYKKHLKKKVKQNECEQKALKLIQIASKRKLTCHEEIEFNKLDKLITTIMLNADNNITGRNNT